MLSRHWRWAETMRTLRHELTHYLLAAHFEKMPPWLNEGLAKFFELGPPYGSAHPGCLRTLANTLRRDNSDILRRIVALPEGVHLSKEQYAQAWALVHFLASDPRWGMGALKQYLKAVDSGVDQVAQFEKSFGRRPEAAHSSWRRHLLKLQGQAEGPVP